jgi:capsid protein
MTTFATKQTPLRTILFSSYYDATASTKEQDYGHFTAITAEDFYFSSSMRCIALGRLRREVRNNPYLAGLVQKYPEAVGYAMLRSTTSSRTYNTLKEKWARKLAKRITTEGRTMRSLEKILKIELLLAGELFLVKRVNGRLQVIASEYCGSPSSAPSVTRSDGGTESNGIIYNADNEPVAYRFGRMKAGFVSFAETEIVPADQVIHVFDPDRVKQGRGLPWLLPSLRTARDLYEITRSKTKQIKDANGISGFIEKQGASNFLQGLDALQPGDDGIAPKAEKPSDPADKVKTDGPIVIELKPGAFIALEPGEKIQTLMSSYNATDYKELIMLMLHAMSTPVGLPVELWFSGLGDVNYSGYKGLGVQWNGRRLDIIDFLVSSFYSPLYEWRVGKAVDEDDLPHNPDGPDGDEEKVEWVFRRTPVLDDEKEGKSNKIKLETGETDLAEIWEAKGYTEEEVFSRRRRLWIKAKIAAGELAEDKDHSQEKVPMDFLIRNELPGETTVPHIPDGSGQTSATDAQAAADEAQAAADQAKTAATEARAALEEMQRTVEALRAQLEHLQRK